MELISKNIQCHLSADRARMEKRMFQLQTAILNEVRKVQPTARSTVDLSGERKRLAEQNRAIFDPIDSCLMDIGQALKNS